MAFLCSNLPHVDVFVKKEYLYDLEKGHGELEPGLWISVKSIQGRALYFETYLPNYGALYDKLPISAFVWKEDYGESLPLSELQLWDCFSYDISVIEKNFLGGNMCKYLSPQKKWYGGHYMFTIDSCNATNQDINVGFSETPSQHKSFNIIKLENGHFAAQPNNRVIFYDKSYTPSKMKMPDFKVSTVEYGVEGENKWTAGDSEDFFYDLKERE
jgi:hypothetical protein|tara:strand:- start:204 stop:845 length:642 start_codon:yes stop_codon:yes gene_type:complete